MKRHLLPLTVLLLEVAAVALAWPHLPELSPVHWDFSGAPNGYGSRLEVALFGPVMVAFLWALWRVLPAIDPRRREAQRDPEATPEERTGSLDSVMGLVIVLVAALHGMTLAVATGVIHDVRRAFALAMAAFLLGSGNVFGRLRPGWFVGIRTPWTLSSPEIWRQTHRLAGRLMVGAGVMGVLVTLLLPGTAAFASVTVLLLVATGVPAVWSFVLWRRSVA